MTRWRLISTAVAATVLLAVLAPPAVAQTGEFERITARVLAGWVNQDNGKTRFDGLIVYNASSPTSVVVACRGQGCGFSETPLLRVPDSGILRLSGLRGLRRPVPPGTVLEVTIYAPDGQKLVTFRTRRRGDPVVARRCSFPGALPSACSAPCPPPTGIDGSYCATAGEVLELMDNPFDWAWELYPVAPGGSYAVLTRMLLRGVRAGVTVGVLCFGKSCPFGSRFYVATHNFVRLDGGLRGQRLKPGTVIEVRVLLGNALGTVVRLVVRRSVVPRLTRLCIYPAELEPRRCPPS